MDLCYSFLKDRNERNGTAPLLLVILDDKKDGLLAQATTDGAVGYYSQSTSRSLFVFSYASPPARGSLPPYRCRLLPPRLVEVYCTYWTVVNNYSAAVVQQEHGAAFLMIVVVSRRGIVYCVGRRRPPEPYKPLTARASQDRRGDTVFRLP